MSCSLGSYIYISKDVLFNETRFPYPTLFQASSSNSTSFDNNSTFSSNIPILEVPLLSPVPITQVPPPSPTLSIHPNPPTPNSPSKSSSSSSLPSPHPQPPVQTLPNVPVLSIPSPLGINSPAPSADSFSSVSSESPSPGPTHTMLTRSKTGCLPPKLYPKLYLTQMEPTSVK